MHRNWLGGISTHACIGTGKIPSPEWDTFKDMLKGLVPPGSLGLVIVGSGALKPINILLPAFIAYEISTGNLNWQCLASPPNGNHAQQSSPFCFQEPVICGRGLPINKQDSGVLHLRTCPKAWTSPETQVLPGTWK